MVRSWVINTHQYYDPAQYLTVGRISIGVRDDVEDILIVLLLHKLMSTAKWSIINFDESATA